MGGGGELVPQKLNMGPSQRAEGRRGGKGGWGGGCPQPFAPDKKKKKKKTPTGKKKRGGGGGGS